MYFFFSFIYNLATLKYVINCSDGAKHNAIVCSFRSLFFSLFLFLIAYQREFRRLSNLSLTADGQVRDLLLHSMNDMSSNSQGRWLQQTCTLFIQSGVQLLAEFTRQAAAWANGSLIRTNFSQPNQSVSQHLELAGNSRGERSHHTHTHTHCAKAAGGAELTSESAVSSQGIIVRLLKAPETQSSVNITLFSQCSL